MDKARDETSEFAVGLGRACAGALIFSLPMIMTMEMWTLGFTMSPMQMFVFLCASVPLLVGLSFFGGFKNAVTIGDHVADVFIALLLAAVTVFVCLSLLGVIDGDSSAREAIGKVTIQTVPGAIGAMLARSQLGEKSAAEEADEGEESYLSALFLMGIGALFLSLNVAPTEEIMLIAHRTSALQRVVIVLVSLTLMHLFVYAANFRGGSSMQDTGFLAVFCRYTMTGYMIVVTASLVLLWFFGRAENTAFSELLSMAVVLSFPGSIGAAAARLIL